MPMIPLRPKRDRRSRDERPELHIDESTLLVLMAAIVAALVFALAHSGAALAAGRLPAPRLSSPVADAPVQSVPPFAWQRVANAARYEFQLSADPGFRSIVKFGGFQTPNTYATVETALPDGNYFWRVRAITAKNKVGLWSTPRGITKQWTAVPDLVSPARGATVTYPSTPLVLRWSAVPQAYKYRLVIATDPSLANSALGDRIPNVETSGTAFALPTALAPGRYYWAVTPLDAEKHSGAQSAVSSFDWSWPTQTTTRVRDVNDNAEVFDPQFSWDPVPGAAQYQVEVNPSEDFAPGSRVCCDETITGTSLAPLRVLPNNTYYWRVRAIDMDGNAGQWNAGPEFRKGFDDVLPTIPRLRVRDSQADRTPAVGASGFPTTDSPVIEWDPVPGAASYEVRVAPWEAPGFCNWTENAPGKPPAKTFLTATTAWTQLAPRVAGSPVGNAFPFVANDLFWNLFPNTSYCVRVRARADRDPKFAEVVSDWTQVTPAFTYQTPAASSCAPASTPAGAYHPVDAIRRGDGAAAEMPLLTWDRVPGACGYFVVVARDRAMTKVVDVAYTRDPDYAPRQGLIPTTYPDETTQYWWSVVPTVGSDGTGASTSPTEDNPQSFEKRTVPPRLLEPAQGGDVRGQPTFRWSDCAVPPCAGSVNRVIGPREYRIQVADDPTFGSPIDDVVTNNTAYTSTSTYPADTVLYWRVRANDENRVGLTWSETGSFRRRLPIPAVGPNPEGGESIPTLSWSPVEGAVSYDMHVEQVDGTKRDFTMRSTAFTPVIFYGTGIWRWQVRANFKSGFKTVSGGYSSPTSFTRRIATPTGLRVARNGPGALVSWDPAVMAQKYRVQFSDSDSFSTVIEQVTTDNTSVAPKMIAPQFGQGKALYWRVATVDEGNNAGGWAAAALAAPKPLRLRVSGALRHGRRGTVRVTVTSTSGRGVRAAVTLSGVGVMARPRRASSRGAVTFRVRPSKRGKLRVRAEAKGYLPAAGSLRVR